MARYGREFGGRGRSWRGWASEDVEFGEYGPGPRYEPGPSERQQPRYGAERIRRSRTGQRPERGYGYPRGRYDFEFGGRGGYPGGGQGAYGGGGFRGRGRGYYRTDITPRGWGPNLGYYRGSSTNPPHMRAGRGMRHEDEFTAGPVSGYGNDFLRRPSGRGERGYEGRGAGYGMGGREMGGREMGGREMGGREMGGREMGGRPQFHYGHTPTDRWPGDEPEAQTTPTRGDYSDGEVRDSVQEALFHDSWVNPDTIDVDVDDGVVTLKGEVNDFMEARYAWDDAWETPGVRGVINNLTVRTDREQDEMELPQTQHATPTGSRSRSAGKTGGKTAGKTTKSAKSKKS